MSPTAPQPRYVFSKLLLEYSSAWARSFFGDKDKAAWEFRELALKCHSAGVPMLSRPCLERAVQLAPKQATFRIDLGWVHYAQANLAQAKAQFEKALDLEYRNANALIGLATTLH